MVETLTPTAAAELLATTHVDIVDVRDADEWLTGHLDGSRLVPLDDLRADPEAHLGRHTAILFVCAKGVRSLTAAKLAERFGFAQLYSLDGGTREWARAGYELVTAAARVAA